MTLSDLHKFMRPKRIYLKKNKKTGNISSMFPVEVENTDELSNRLMDFFRQIYILKE
jgi:hypothetical protein